MFFNHFRVNKRNRISLEVRLQKYGNMEPVSRTRKGRGASARSPDFFCAL